MPGVLARLPGTLSDPAAAWPAPDRARLPGPIGFYAVAAVVLAVLATAIVVAARVARRLGHARSEQSGARWARARDLRALRRAPRRRPGASRSAGSGGAWSRPSPRASTIVIGPSQSGKTAGLAIPAILEAAGPVLAVSVKRDLLDHTLRRPASAAGRSGSTTRPARRASIGR